MIEQPAWIIYAREKVRPVLEAEASRHPKGPSRTYESTLRSSYDKAVREFGYEGSERDWLFLLKQAQLPGDAPNPEPPAEPVSRLIAGLDFIGKPLVFR